MTQWPLDVFFHDLQEVSEDDFGGRDMLAGIIKRMDMPTDESIVGTKDSDSIFNESIRAKAALTLLLAPVSGASPGPVSSSTRPRGARSLPVRVRRLLEHLGADVSLLP